MARLKRGFVMVAEKGNNIRNSKLISTYLWERKEKVAVLKWNGEARQTDSWPAKTKHESAKRKQRRAVSEDVLTSMARKWPAYSKYRYRIVISAKNLKRKWRQAFCQSWRKQWNSTKTQYSKLLCNERKWKARKLKILKWLAREAEKAFWYEQPRRLYISYDKKARKPISQKLKIIDACIEN